MFEWIIAFLILFASLLVLLASIGLLRFPDLPTRMHATTKSGVLAVCVIMVAVGIYFGRADVTTRVIAVILFTLITAPVATHAIGRAGYYAGITLWPNTVKDELGDYYSGSTPKERNKK